MNASLFASRPELSTPLTPILTVNTVDMTGAPVSGYYAVFYLAGLPVASGYSPASFTLLSGITYLVGSDCYGSCAFDHWQDTGSTNNQRSVSITSDPTLTPVMNCGNVVTATTTASTSSASTSSTTSTTTTTTSVTSTTATPSTTASSMGITVYAHRIPAS